LRLRLVDSSLSDWLVSHGLERFATLFDQNEVDLPTLQLLTDDDLKELGVPFGPRKRILNLIGEERRLEKLSSPNAVGAAVGERRQLTVLFCDMVGFTKLAHRVDPETLQIVVRAYEDTCESCVSRYDGYLFTTLGDGIVAFFGYPLAHEGEAERAIRAGLDIVQAVSELQIPQAGRIQVRIGVAAGMVVVASGERSAVGETMNVASRLQTVARPGSVVVNERVRRLADGLFEYEDLGEHELKGISHLTHVYRIVGMSSAESRFDAAAQRGLSPLVGRELEVSVLLDAWRAVRSSGAGRAVLLRGEAGIGKSRIVDALRDRLGGEVARTFVFQGSPFFLNTAFYPIRTWFERTPGLDRIQDEGQRLDKLEALAVGDLGMARDDLRFLAAMLNLPFQERFGAILISPKLAREETMRTLAEILRRTACAGPTLVVLEDAHWADPSTMHVIGRAVRQFVEIPVLLVATARSEFQSPWSSHSDVSEINLAKFTAAESRTLLDKIVGGRALPPGLAAQIIARTDGVPLFVEELTKTILESGDLVVEDCRLAYAGSSAKVSIPETLRDSLMARLDRVPAAKEIAQVGSVVGREFRYELIAGLELMSEEALTEALCQLTASGVATCRGEIPHAAYEFSHALVQDAAYDSILRTRRKQLHSEIARLLTERWPETHDKAPELLAYHHTAAEQHKLAAPLWLRAGEIAIQRFALLEGITHLRTGMATLTRLHPSKSRDLTELSLRTVLGPALVAQQGWAHPEVRKVLEPAWARAQAHKRRSTYLPILSTLSVHAMSVGALTEALRWSNELLKEGEEARDDGLVIVGHRSAAATYYWRGDFIAARRSGDRVRELYDTQRHWGLALLTNSDPFTGEGIYRSQYLWMLGYPDQAKAANEATEANARRRGHPFDLAFALTLGAQVYEYLGDSEALFSRSEEAERIGKEHGITLLGEILAEITRGVALLRAGRAADAAAQLGGSIGRLKQTGHSIWIWYLGALQAEALAASGRLEEAMALIQESVTKIEAGEERSHYAETLRLRGSILRQAKQPEAAEATLRRAIEVARSQEAKSWELRAATTLAELLWERGRAAEALALLRPIYDWFNDGLRTRDLRAASSLLDKLALAATG
jgi:class 3 adenylate cyclase/tetratricopeptide (TPR) repeat protein